MSDLSDDDMPLARGRLDVPARHSSRRKGRRSLSVGDAEDVERRSGMVDGGNKLKSSQDGHGGMGERGLLGGVKAEEEADLRDSIERELQKLGGAAKNVGAFLLVSLSLLLSFIPLSGIVCL